MPESERAALIALFDATGGPQWAHKVGWLGPPGTECNWHGVDGAAKYSEPTTNVTGLDLHDNNLRGDVPEAFGELPHLKTLHVGDDDALTGKLPPPLLRRWLSGHHEPLGLGPVKAAERLGISLNRLNEIVLGKRGITADTALRLSRLLKTSPQLWMRLQADWDLHQALQREGRKAS